MNNDKDLHPFIASLMLHIFFLYIFFFGLPHLYKPLPVDKNIISVEILPISDKANVQTKRAQKEKKLEAENSKKVEKAKLEQKLEAVAVAEKESKIEPPKKIPEKLIPEMNNKDQIKIKELEKKIEKTDKKEEKKKDKAKLNKKDEFAVKTKDQKRNNDSDLDSLLKTLEQTSDAKGEAKTKQKSRNEKNDVDKEAEGIFDETMQQSIDYQSLLKQQIKENWNIPIGVVDKTFGIKFNIRYNVDGTLIDYRLIDKSCNALDAITCQALIESAQRAISATNPIKNMDPIKYDEWKDINYTFTPDLR